MIRICLSTETFSSRTRVLGAVQPISAAEELAFPIGNGLFSTRLGREYQILGRYICTLLRKQCGRQNNWQPGWIDIGQMQESRQKTHQNRARCKRLMILNQCICNVKRRDVAKKECSRTGRRLNMRLQVEQFTVLIRIQDVFRTSRDVPIACWMAERTRMHI
ncbi:hypothetical protein K402DRAFT_267217 [Aulographum hederae CBS 113979]|uniref:Uncharacterized protein n=1 Tax=Aulographum hederae CBS 113979 TaxID=1176131 RepID=A0A6G1GIL0_9PEZI|nr:hypothetical protein K402DRAFT_267217 [Aulographum hederae CBS 113979]